MEEEGKEGGRRGRRWRKNQGVTRGHQGAERETGKTFGSQVKGGGEEGKGKMGKGQGGRGSRVGARSGPARTLKRRLQREVRGGG